MKMAALTLLLRALTAVPADSQILTLGQPAACTQDCDYVYNPVCGTDELTYPNYCFLLRASCVDPIIRPQRYGSCVTPDPCNYVCDRSYRPACGSDGKSYSNPCVLMYFSCLYPSRQLYRRHFGRCIVEGECPRSCGRQRVPVCGSDRRTYTNECFLLLEACAGRRVTKDRNGACDACPRSCTREYLPVCGDDGVTYPNKCVLESQVCENKQVSMAYDGPCNEQQNNSPQRECSSACPFIYEPKCGSDGKTYGNQCALEAASCRNPSITKVKDGECGTTQACPVACPDVYAPVCGSDGVTYENECTLRAVSCNAPSITLMSSGPCENTGASEGGTRSSCQSLSACPTNYSPVCGSDGTTYPNQCALDVAACSDSSITWRSNGLCPIATSAPDTSPTTDSPCANTCSRVFSPVCGSDNETYFNLCLLNLAACRDNRVIDVIREGRCDDPQVAPALPRCPSACHRDYVPVCGTDGITYDNLCRLTAVMCRDASVQKEKDGPCGSSSSSSAGTSPDCNRTCPFTYEPVCGSDRVTYSNPCTFNNAACRDNSLTKLFDGPCV